MHLHPHIARELGHDLAARRMGEARAAHRGAALRPARARRLREAGPWRDVASLLGRLPRRAAGAQTAHD